MRIPLRTPATRRDCILDSQLTPEQQTDLSRRLDDGLPMADAARELLEQHGIVVSKAAISRWAAKRRRAKSDQTLARFFELMEADAHHAGRLSTRQDGAGGHFLEANLMVASRALFAAQCSEDAHGMLRAIKILAAASAAASQAKRAQAALLSAEARTALAAVAQQKLGDERARAKAARAAEAKNARSMDPEVHREKVARAIKRVFGEPPQWAIDEENEARRIREKNAAPARAAREKAAAPAPPAEEPPPPPPPEEAPAPPQPSAPTRAHPNHTLVPSRPRTEDPACRVEPWLKPGEWYRPPPPRLANQFAKGISGGPPA